jgi:hypothetical protein
MKALFASAGIALAATGCSTLTADGTSENITVYTYDTKSEDLPGAKCELQNDYGAWGATTPATVMVHRSNKVLTIRCAKKGYPAGSATVESITKGNMWGNIIFGGGIGAVIDHNNGSAYDYPDSVRVYMGQHNTGQDNTLNEAQDAAPPKGTEAEKADSK